MEHSAPVEDPKKKDGAKKKRKSSNASENTAKKAKTPPKDTSEDKSSGSPKRKQTPTPSAKSVNLLKSFLAKKKWICWMVLLFFYGDSVISWLLTTTSITT